MMKEFQQGRWLSKEQYGVIHRVAGDGQIKGILGMIYVADGTPRIAFEKIN